MSNAPPLSIDGHAVRELTLHVGGIGPWVADCELVEAPSLNGAVRLRIGEVELVGTVTEHHTFNLHTGVTIVGGGGGWTKTLGAMAYHNDAGVKASLIAEDAARAAGETLGSFAPTKERVGEDYARAVATASSVLEYAAGGAAWWVDYDGVTHVGARPSGEVTSSSATLLNYDAVHSIAEVGVDSFAELVPGARLVDSRLDGDAIIRDVELVVRDGTAMRASCWLAASATSHGRLPALLRGIVERVAGGRLYGVYRYRVVSVLSDKRLDLQAARASSGLPDLRRIAQWPGVPGIAAEPTAGCEVLVMFVDGDPASPLITGYVGPNGESFAPVSLTIGGDTGQPAARQGDSVVVLLPPMSATGTMLSTPPVPFTAILQPLQPQVTGQITTGSGKVKVAT